MPTSYEDKIKEQARHHIEAGERVLAALIAQPRGATMAKVGGVGPGTSGGRKMRQERRAAGQGGLRLTSPMALALTDSRLLVLSVTRPIAKGKGGDAKELVSAVALSEVDSIEVKRLLVGKVVIVTVRGPAVKLEAGPGSDTKGLAEEFARADTRVTQGRDRLARLQRERLFSLLRVCAGVVCAGLTRLRPRAQRPLPRGSRGPRRGSSTPARGWRAK